MSRSAGGNSVYTDGLMRTVYDGPEDIRAYCPDLTDEEVAVSDFGTYTEDQFFDDMARNHPIPHQSRPLRNPGEGQPRNDSVDARPGRALLPQFRPPGPIA